MKRFIVGLCVAGLVAFTGCSNTSSTGGRPGTGGLGGGKTTGTGATGTPTNAPHGNRETFELKGPTGTEKVEQGTSVKFKLSISRGKDFKDNVMLKAESPDPKLHVTLEPNEFRGSENKDVEVTVAADPDAKIGEDHVRITGTPQSGNPTTLDVKVDVTARPKNK